MFRFLASVALLAGAISANAADDTTKTITDALHTIAPKAAIQSIAESSLPGFFSVVVDGHVVFISGDGKYLIEGHVLDIATRHDLASEGMSVVRKEGLAKIPQDKRLIFAPPHPKYTVTVFTDVDCPYCRQFHKQIAEYNRLGIAVRYVLYPLDFHPGADKKAAAVWCAKDRNAAYTAAMNGQDPGTGSCTNPVAETKALGETLGINATPTVLAEDGTMVDNAKAVSPTLLAAELDRKSAVKNKPVASNYM
jgi:thiol:disulfide interchange protein DsbC